MFEEEININDVFLILFGIALLIVFTMIFLFVAFNHRKNKMMQLQLKESLAFQKKAHELELSALRGQMNPHFVHNSLNAIQYYIQRNEVEISEDYLAKFSKLMRLFFDYSRKKTITLKEEINLLRRYLEIEKLRFEEKLNYEFVIDPKLDVDEQVIPSMILQPIVENAVNHGLFHKTESGMITISFEVVDEDSYAIKIVDDGIGINKAREMSVKLGRAEGSHSSTVLEERLEVLKQSESWNVVYRITDRKEISDLSGTEVFLTFNQIFES